MLVPIFDPLIFNFRPDEDENLTRQFFVAPKIMPALLDARSSLVSGERGSGKTTLGLVCASYLSKKWLCVFHPLNRAEELEPYALRGRIVQHVWEMIQAQPQRLKKMGVRARALRYFLDHYLGVEMVAYRLDTLIEDEGNSDNAEYLKALRGQSPGDLFNAQTPDNFKWDTLSDCVSRMDLEGIMVWIDVPHLSPDLPETRQIILALENFFNSLNLTRQPLVHFKCLAPPFVCDTLMNTSGIVRRTAERLDLLWSQKEVIEILARRLDSLGIEAQWLEQIFDLQHTEDFLKEFSYPHSPAEWLALTRIILEHVKPEEYYSHSGENWKEIRKRYLRERIKIRRDTEGYFWRGPRRLDEITPRKRAIYSLVAYLYEHPGMQKIKTIANEIATNRGDESLEGDRAALNTNLFRARAVLEPKLDEGVLKGDEAIYLVTDISGSSYSLQHTDQSGD